MFTCGFFTQTDVFENEFPNAFSYKNCAGCAIRKSHIAVLVAIRKSQLAVRKKSLKKLCIKILMKSTPGLSILQSI